MAEPVDPNVSGARKQDLQALVMTPARTGTARETLESALADVLKKARVATGWYWVGKRAKKRGALAFRYPVLLLGAMAAAWPLAREIVNDADLSWGLHPLGSTLLLILAGLLLAYDRFGDQTSGWVRYVRAGTRLNSMIESFEVEMAIERATLSDPPTRKEAVRWLTKCLEFIRGVNAVVENETEQWAVAFQETIRQLDENLAQARQERPAARPGRTVGVSGDDGEDEPLDVEGGGRVAVKPQKDKKVEVAAGAGAGAGAAGEDAARGDEPG